MTMKRFWKWRYIIPAAIVVAPFALSLFAFLAGGLVMLLWNWLLPPLFGWPSLTVWQGFGLLVLCRLLFGGFGGGGHKSSGMTSEERERVRHHMRRRVCSASNEDADPQSGGSNPPL